MRRRSRVGVGVAVVMACIFAYHFLGTASDKITGSSPIAPTTVRTSLPARVRSHHATIAGEVTDASASPLTGVRVCAVREATSNCVVTDTRGRYQILELQAAEYIVRAGFPRHVLPHQQTVLLHVLEQRTLDLVMPIGGAEITGTVSDLGGGPIANASVTASLQIGNETTAPVETDQNGVFHLWCWTVASYVTASADGYVDGTEPASAPGLTNIIMVPEATLAGTVIDARTRQPIEGAEVTLNLVDNWIGPEKSDERGRFEFRKLRFGHYNATARTAHGYGVSDGSVAAAIGPHVDGLVVELHPAGSIVGRAVIVGSPEKPCAKAKVFMINYRDGTFSRPDVAADGTFRIDGLPPGSYSPSVECPGFAQVGDVAQLELDTADVSATWKFGEGAILRGHVRDQNGAPIGRAEVSANSYPSRESAVSKTDGTYEIRGLSPGSYYVGARAEHALSFSKVESRVQVGERATIEHDIVVIPNGAIAGVVVDRDGHPHAGAKLIVSCRNSYPGTTAGSDGTFRFDDIPIDEADIMVDLGIENLRQTVAIRPNATSEVRFVVDTGSAVVSGVVLDEQGQPAADVVVTVSREGVASSWNATRFETGRDGNFAFRSLPEGTYKVQATRGESPTVTIEHVATGSVTTIRFEPVNAIAGSVRSTDGSALTDFTISLRSGETQIRSERFFKNGGHYHLDDVPAGKFDLAVVTATGGEGHLAIELGKGERRDNVDLAIDASLVVTGRVIDLVSHQPIAGINVYARVEGPGGGQRATTDSEGRFAIPGLAHGSISVEVYQPTFTSSDIKRSAPAGASLNLGDIVITKNRYDDHNVGTLGLSVAEDRTIDAFETNSAGQKAGLVVGDVITTIDGIDVAAATGRVIFALTLAPVGTTIRVGVARGATISAVTAKAL